MIFGNEPIVSSSGSALVNVCFKNGDKIVSLALEKWVASSSILTRGSIMLLRQVGTGLDESEDCTGEVLFDVGSSNVETTLKNFNKAMTWLNESG